MPRRPPSIRLTLGRLTPAARAMLACLACGLRRLISATAARCSSESRCRPIVLRPAIAGYCPDPPRARPSRSSMRPCYRERPQRHAAFSSKVYETLRLCAPNPPSARCRTTGGKVADRMSAPAPPSAGRVPLNLLLRPLRCAEQHEREHGGIVNANRVRTSCAPAIKERDI